MNGGDAGWFFHTIMKRKEKRQRREGEEMEDVVFTAQIETF